MELIIFLFLYIVFLFFFKIYSLKFSIGVYLKYRKREGSVPVVIFCLVLSILPLGVSGLMFGYAQALPTIAGRPQARIAVSGIRRFHGIHELDGLHGSVQLLQSSSTSTFCESASARNPESTWTWRSTSLASRTTSRCRITSSAHSIVSKWFFSYFFFSL